MLNSSVASLPPKVRIASSPPGCSPRNLVTSKTWPATTTQQSVLDVCFATSAIVKPPPPPLLLGFFSFFSFSFFAGAAASVAPAVAPPLASFILSS